MKHRSISSWLAALSVLFFAASATAAQRPPIDPNNVDTAISPRDDFYAYANGGWLARTTIPEDQGRWGAFEELAASVIAALQRIAEAAAASSAPAGSVTQKVGDFYASGMDEAGIEAAGSAPLDPVLQAIAAIADANDVATMVAKLHQVGVVPFFAVGASPDAHDSSRIILQVQQAGMGLRVRDYYTDPNRITERTAYSAHVAAMFGLLGAPEDQARHAAEVVLELETSLAQHALSEVEKRDQHATYNIVRASELPAGFAWPVYLTQIQLAEPGDINIQSPAYLHHVAALIERTPLADLRTYLTWHAVHTASRYLSHAFVDENFAFYGKTLLNIQAMEPRSKRVLGALDTFVGEALGQLYVEAEFPPQVKERTLTLIADLRASLAEHIQNLSWMSPATRAKALEKLHTLTVKVGHPDVWIDYSNLAISRSYFTNVLRASAFLFDRDIAQVGHPTDRSRWEMTPQTVNAYYSPAANEIVFPAAILQYPFFDAAADDAFNYGGLGGVIGHELTHGFDDQGRQYDAAGNLVDWWTAEDGRAFDARARRVIEQFDGYSVYGQPINGALTQGENIADLGGCKIAFAALQSALQRSGLRACIDGFTPEQRFFLAWAQVWRNLVREKTALQRLQTDPHSPGEWRTKGPLANMPAFYEAFGVQPGDGMYRDEDVRAEIW